MRVSKVSMLAGFMIAFTLIFELAAHADEANQRTKFTFSQPVQVPGRVLAAGTYEFELANTGSGPNVIEILNATGTKVLATYETIPTDRTGESDPIAVTLAEHSDGQPATIVSWFYPGMDTGHQFLYSKQVQRELAQDTKATLVGERGVIVNSDANGVGN
jgi:hypothetical protein